MKSRDLLISDPHGCAEELDALLKLVSYTPNDRLIFGGDLVDRGPDSVGVVRRARELNAISVMGNHDEWYVRCVKHDKNEKENGKPNPLKNRPKYSLFKQMSEDDLAYLAAMPYYYRLNENMVVIHAGMRPGVPVEQQHKGHLLRMRYIQHKDGEMWSSVKAPPPEIATKWTDLWTGPEDVIYGHQPSKGDAVYTQNNGIRMWGIDTGCCFGNRLTAMLITDRIEFASVPAKAKYAEWFLNGAE